MQKLEGKEKFIFSFLQLVFLKTKGHTPITSLDLEKTAEMYELDEGIVKILFDKGILVKNGTPDGYTWGNWGDINFSMLKEIKPIYDKLEDKEPEKKVSKSGHTIRRWTAEELVYLMTSSAKLKRIGKQIGRTEGAVSVARSEVRKGNFKHLGVYFDESGKLITPEGTKPVSDYRKTTDEQIQGIIDTLDLPVAEAMKVLGVKKQFVYDTRHRLKKGKFEKRGFFYPHEEEPVHLSRIPEPPVAEEKPQPEPEVIVEVEEPELIQAPPKESRSGKRWTNEEIEFIRNSTGNDPEWVAEQLNRTVNAVKAARYAIENGSLVEGEERKKKVVTMDTKPRRKFSILWGLISWES